MSSAEAIKMGSAFVEFFADRERLDRMTSDLGGDMKSWATATGGEIATNIGAGFNVAQAAAVSFGASAATGMAIVSNAIQKTSAWLIDVPNRFLALAGGIGTIAGNIGDIARGAGIANFALGGTSRILQRMGFETKFIDKVSTGMKTIAWDARRAQFGIDLMLSPLRILQGTVAKIGALGLGAFNVGIRSLGGYTKDTEWLASVLGRTATNAMRAVFSFRTLVPLIRLTGTAGRAVGSLAMMPIRAVRSVAGGLFSGRTAMRGAQLASVASLGAMAADNVTQGAEQEQQESGGFSKYLQPILTGLMIGGPIGIAAAGLGIFISSQLNKGAEDGAGAFDGLINRGRAWGAWIGGMFGQVKDKVVSTFEKVTAGSEPFLTRLEKAFIPLTHAIENVWLPAAIKAIDWVGSLFIRNTDSMEQSWSDWILSGVSTLADFVGNIDLYFRIGREVVAIWAVNAGLRVENFFTNAVQWGGWFLDNFTNIFRDAGNIAAQFFSGDFLLEGFTSSLSKLPDATRAALLETTPELEKLYAELGRRQADAMANGRMIADAERAAEEVRKRGRGPDAVFGAISARSQEGYSLLAQLQNRVGQRDPVADNTKAMVEEAKKTNRKLDKIAQKEGGLMAWAIPG